MSLPGYDHLMVVVVNWNRPADTIECVQSVLRSGVPANRVLVVDNGSSDQSSEKIAAACPGIKLHALPGNEGFTGGYNFGIDLALDDGAELIFILNNDTVIDAHTIQELMNANWDISVPRIYFYDTPAMIWSAGGSWRRFPPMVTMRGFRRKDGKAYDRPIPLDYATACALMVKRKVFEKAGKFDRAFESYNEDYDFAYRVKQAGFRMGYVPEARVWHKGSLTLRGDPSKIWYYLGRNTVLLYRKENRFPVTTLLVVLAWVTLRELIKLNYRIIPDYWRGIKAGLEWLKHGTG